MSSEVEEAIDGRDVLQVDHSPCGGRMRVIVAASEGGELREEALFFDRGRLVRRRLVPAGGPRVDFFEAFASRK